MHIVASIKMAIVSFDFIRRAILYYVSDGILYDSIIHFVAIFSDLHVVSGVSGIRPVKCTDDCLCKKSLPRIDTIAKISTF